MRSNLAIVLIASSLAAACGDDSPASFEFRTEAPEQQGMDAAVLDGARAYAFAPDRHTQGVVVTRREVIVAEWYEDGADVDTYAASWSVAKSVTSALVGIAVDDGDIADVGVPLTDYYPQWQGTPREPIELEHVLHMATGLAWDETYNLRDARNSDVAKLVTTTDSPLAYVLERPVEAAPDTVFNYSSGDALLLSGVLEQATGMTVGEYAQARLFAPLGITGAQWWSAKTGETLTYCCLDMTTRDFARFGLLYLRDGDWNGTQVVPASWVQRSLAPSPADNGYGYQWWLTGRANADLPADLAMAVGHDGQFIYIIPSLELVIVRNGHYDKFPGEPIADPTLFLRYPSDGLTPGAGTLPPDEWSHAEFLQPILASITD